MRRKQIFVISDLHLGGGKGFQMCSAKEKLAEFIGWVTNQSLAEMQTEFNLVLDGDIIDFLAEKEWKPFTANEDDAINKIEAVFENFRVVWDALQKYVASGSVLTILLGNHDLEMCLPKVRRRLLEELGDGRIQFLYDNEAFVLGEIIIEHGNRYDPWNAINHDVLRQIRSALSRNESVANDLEVPGSVLVHAVMNPIKETYPFIDLLKPEDAAVALLISVLEPSKYALLKLAVRPAFLSTRVRHDNSMVPINSENIAGHASMADELKNLDVELQNIIGFNDANIAGIAFQEVLDTLKGFGKVVLSNLSRSDEQRLDHLYKGFRYLIAKHRLGDTQELDSYEIAANTLSEKFKIVVFGHTHKAKQLRFSNGSTYFNSGTWADVILLPQSLLEGDEETGKQDLREFMSDMLSGTNFQRWIKHKGTFVKICLNENNKVIDSGLFHFVSETDPEVSI